MKAKFLFILLSVLFVIPVGATIKKHRKPKFRALIFIGVVKLTAKAGYGFSNTTTSTSSTEINTQIGSDNLGTLSFLFYDPIIRAESNGSYKLYNASSGDMEATLIPTNLLSK